MRGVGGQLWLIHQSMLGRGRGAAGLVRAIAVVVHGLLHLHSKGVPVAVVAPETPTADSVAAHRGPRRAPRRPRRRALSERITLNVVVGIVAALLAFVLAAALLADRREMTTVVVARGRIAAGTPLTAELVRGEEVPANTEFVATLLALDQLNAGGWVVTRTLQAGESIPLSAIGDSGSVVPRRVMSIPLDRAQAANGAIEVGDQVDVIVTSSEGEARYVLRSAAVVDRSADGSSGGLVGGSASSDLVISVEVDEAQALEVAAAIQAGTISVVRSTGFAVEPEPEVGG
jgi:Flp pilus assembly protein CpaB